MNKFNSDKTKDIQNIVLNNFAAKAFGRDLSINNIFVEREQKNMEAFNKTIVNIPWYLKPFSKKIINIAYLSFKNGLTENRTDTVTIKRPTEYNTNE